MRKPSFLHLAEPVCSDNLVARFSDRGEVPELLVVERVGVFSSLEEYSCHCGEVVLKTVVAVRKKTRAEGSLKHPVLKLYGVTVL